MLWMFSDFERLAKERAEIDRLQSTVSWLKGASWTFQGGSLLKLDADIEAQATIFQVRMIYPDTFPATPPSVFPRENNQWWSPHQYGAGGELCLEWGPDNWLPEVTGAQMLESAHKLLQTENLLTAQEGQQPNRVESRHALSQGQEMRSSFLRLICPDYLGKFFEGLSPESIGKISVAENIDRKGSWIEFVTEVEPRDKEPWRDHLIPERLKRHTFCQQGIFAKTNIKPSNIKNLGNIQQLQESLNTNKVAHEFFKEAIKDFENSLFILVVDSDNGLNLFWTSKDRKNFLLSKTLILPAFDSHERDGTKSEQLKSKRVGIVGLGSAGSKIAVMLARSGLKNFVLVDDDIFLPENICRHELDWRSIGEHKVVAIEDQLSLIFSDVKVDVRRVRLTGQESATTVAGAMHALSECDVIIDATAHPETFNRLASIFKQFKRTIIWLEIYGGGIGGLVARSRYGKDASPQHMRASYNAYTSEREETPPVGIAPYTTAGEADPLIATDAEVGIIASHAARFALDAFLDKEPSAFPYSMYLVGLERGWIFDQPFHTIPIDTGPPEINKEPDYSNELVQEEGKFLLKLLEDANGESDNAG